MRFIRDVFGCHVYELGKTGGGRRQSCMIRSILDVGSSLGNMATADAGDGLSRTPQQDTGGSDALCLGAPPVPRGTHLLNIKKMSIQARPR